MILQTTASISDIHPHLFSLMRSTSNKSVDHLREESLNNTTLGFQEMKKGKLMLKPVNMNRKINQKGLPSIMNNREDSASMYPR